MVLVVADQLPIAARPQEVYDCIWDAELWPRITSHVQAVQILEAGDRHQRLSMTVLANGRSHTVESIREGVPGERVTYRQTRPPAFLDEHSGEWRLEPASGGVVVHLTHRAVVDHSKAMAALRVSSPEEADRLIADTLRRNGERTLLAIKAFLEEGRPPGQGSGQR